jgi:hypothetical protein
MKKHHWHAFWHEKLFEKHLQPHCQTRSISSPHRYHLLFSSGYSSSTFFFLPIYSNKKKRTEHLYFFFSLRNLNVPHLYLQLFYDYLLSFIGLIDKRDGELNLVAYMWYCGDHPSGVESSWWWGKNMKFLFLISKKEIKSSSNILVTRNHKRTDCV